jgi:23S rRNA pseudoU1915 N3-methylase RlmH
MGPEIIGQFLDPSEYIKRLAAAQGIDVLNLVKSAETMEQEKQEQMQQMQQQELMKQAGALSKAPLADPSKNPAMGRSLNDGYDQLNGQDQGEPPAEGEEEAPPEG